jgi:hypothetical protein
MKLNFAVLAIVATLVPLPAFAADETWSVTEGSDGTRRAVWHVNSERGRIAGQATLIDRNGQKITFGLAGYRRGDEVTVQRVQASDGSHCSYRGRISRDGSGGGSILCGSQRSTWTVARQ